MNMIFNTIVGWPVEEHKIIEQYKRFCKNGKNEIFTVGKCLYVIPKIIMNSGCPEVDFATIRQEDRPKEDDKFSHELLKIVSIYEECSKSLGFFCRSFRSLKVILSCAYTGSG